jgi:hypothetical protein
MKLSLCVAIETRLSIGLMSSTFIADRLASYESILGPTKSMCDEA